MHCLRMDDRRKYHGLHDESSRGQPPSSCTFSFRCSFDPQILKYPPACGSSEWVAVPSLDGNHPQRPQARAYHPNLRKLSLTISYRQTSSSTAISALVSPTTDSSRLYRIRTLSIPVAQHLSPLVPFDIWHRNYSIPQASVWTPAIQPGKVTSMPSGL